MSLPLAFITMGGRQHDMRGLGQRDSFETIHEPVHVQSLQGELHGSEGSRGGLGRFGQALVTCNQAFKFARVLWGWIEAVRFESQLKELEREASQHRYEIILRDQTVDELRNGSKE